MLTWITSEDLKEEDIISLRCLRRGPVGVEQKVAKVALVLFIVANAEPWYLETRQRRLLVESH